MDKRQPRKNALKDTAQGQALVEYVLILILIVLALLFVIQLTGAAIGNLFGDTVFQLRGATFDPNLMSDNVATSYYSTLTAAAANPLVIPTTNLTRTPTDTPEGWVAPESTSETTPDPSLPTQTPTLVVTPPTPPPPIPDMVFPFPYNDPIDNPENWRVEEEFWLGPQDWYGWYFPGTQLDYSGASAALAAWNSELYGIAATGVLNFPKSSFNTWQTSATGPIENWPTASPYNNFSIRFQREITIDEEATVRFTAQYDDGFRLWLMSPGQDTDTCSATGRTSGDPYSTGLAYGPDSSYPTDCLLIDDWRPNGHVVTKSVTRTLAPGTYILQVDYFEVSSYTRLALTAGVLSNPDDTVVNNAGAPVEGTINCGWAQTQNADDANTLYYNWISYPNNEIPQYMQCHLELRGYIPIEPESPLNPDFSPEFVFWDLWHMDSTATSTWVEFAVYEPDIDSPTLALNRDNLDWLRVDLHPGTGMNYNWTRHAIDLSSVTGTNSAGTTVTQSYVGEYLTFRFVIQNLNSTTTRRWYVDDILVHDSSQQLFPLDQEWQMNITADEDDFIHSGQWSRNGNNAMSDGADPGSWELKNINNRYANHTQSPSSLDTLNNNDALRIHYLELDGMVDEAISLTDSDGDTGEPVLSFMHGYKIGRYTGLEVQYYDVVANQWLPIPGAPGATQPAGILEPITYSALTYRDYTTLSPTTISLEYIPQVTYRLRFAMLVHNQANMRLGGWWIDNIRLHRKDRETFLDYPFLDNAESGIGNWLPTGTWARTNTTARDGAHSFTDSPGGNYAPNANTVLRTLHPIDLNNDTPANVETGGNTGGAAANPYLTFYHRRYLRSGDALHVEWRRHSETDAEWKPLWAYIYGMETIAGVNSPRTGQQNAWEFVRINLSSITYNKTDPNKIDDDILIRFRLQSDGFYEGDGVYIDTIRLEEYTEVAYKWWPLDSARTIGGINYGTGNGKLYTADVDEANWAARWRADGTWLPITWEQRQGLRAWHDSAQGQTAAPVYQNSGWINATRSPVDSFNVLEMASIIDLTAALQSERPTLYFWTRYHAGFNERMMVQISYELPVTTNHNANMAARCNNPALPQCYEQIRGWSEWQTTNINWTTNWKSTYSWQREQVDLSPYASDGTTPGRRIRIRFVYDTLDNSSAVNSRDGWYIDNVSIEPRYDLNILANISTMPFEDMAQNIDNWVGEGIWGLSPEYYRISSAGTGIQGNWTESFWDCYQCVQIGQALGAPLSDAMAIGADYLLDHNGSVSSLNATYQNQTPVTRTVTDINYDIYTGYPYAGFTKTDYFVGRWVLETTQIGAPGAISAGKYTIYVTADNGMRVKLERITGPGGTVVGTAPASDAEEWNVIYYWSDHGRALETGEVTFEEGYYYRLTVEWYERDGNAALIVDTGSTSYSFTDSPKQGAGTSFPDIPTIANSNSSLILDGALDLTETTNPILEYYTIYEMQGSARVEVSTDGGFTWTQSGLQDGFGSEVMDSPTWGATAYIADDTADPPQDWERRRHNLVNYVGQTIMIRFRMDNDNLEVMDFTTDYTPYVSLWVTDIRVREGGEATAICGDGVCSTGENNANCPADCPAPTPLPAVCGNDVCESGESNANCPADCPAEPTATSTPDVCLGINYSNFQTNDGAKQMQFTINNASGGAITLSVLEMQWQSASNKNGDLMSISLVSGNVIYNTKSGPVGTDNDLDIPGDRAWAAGSRVINSGTSPALIFLFDKGAEATGYLINLTFSNGCAVTVNVP